MKAARAMLAGTVQEVWDALHAAHEGRVVLQLAAPDLREAPQAPELPEMLQWRASHRAVFHRHLMQQRAPIATAPPSQHIFACMGIVCTFV